MTHITHEYYTYSTINTTHCDNDKKLIKIIFCEVIIRYHYQILITRQIIFK